MGQEHLTGAFEVRLPAGAQQAVGPDLGKPAREHVLQEPGQEPVDR